jgi:hypothetical protein
VSTREIEAIRWAAVAESKPFFAELKSFFA